MVFKGQFLQPPSHTKVVEMNLSNRKVSSLEDYVHHTKTQIQKSGLESDIWLIACFVNGITNLAYHWIVHNKDLKSFEEVVETVCPYQCTSKKDITNLKHPALSSHNSIVNTSHPTNSCIAILSDKILFACLAKRSVTQKSNVGNSNVKSMTTKTKLQTIMVSFLMSLRSIHII